MLRKFGKHYLLLTAIILGCAVSAGFFLPLTAEISDDAEIPYDAEKPGDDLSEDEGSEIVSDAPQPDPTPDTSPVLALVVDDCGFNMKFAHRLFARRLPITWAIIPNTAYSKETAALLDEGEVPYLIHLPMQANGDPSGKAGDPKHYCIGAGMSRDDVRAMVLPIIESMPNAVGVNNHRGSLATSDRQLMNSLMSVLSEHDLFFLDSRTSRDSAAYDEARSAGIDAMKNSLFLDNEADRNKIRAQVEVAIDRAVDRGSLIAICHLRPETLAFFESIDDEFFTDRGVRLVTLPELIALEKGGSLP